MGDDVRSLKDALADLSARLERMDAKMTDLKNQMQIMQNPPAAPPVRQYRAEPRLCCHLPRRRQVVKARSRRRPWA